MKVGVPKEVKNHEYRVAITPAGVHELTRSGHEVFIERDAGTGSSIPDGDFVTAGAVNTLLEVESRQRSSRANSCGRNERLLFDR